MAVIHPATRAISWTASNCAALAQGPVDLPGLAIGSVLAQVAIAAPMMRRVAYQDKGIL